MVEQVCAGAGLGLRIPHIQHVLAEKPDIPWFEVHICNFLRGGLNRKLLKQIAEHYPLSFHGVSLNLGGIDPLNSDYLSRLKNAVDEFNPAMISEHACFTALTDNYFHDLLPVPFTKEAVSHFVDRIDQVQNLLRRKILIENVSRYVSYQESDMSEADFLSAVSKKSGCGILLDLNNAYVNQCNLNESLEEFISSLPLQQIGEVHLAGFDKQDEQLIDTHSMPVCDQVWSYYEYFNKLCPEVPCLIEWDSQLPKFTRLQQERDKAQRIMSQNSINQTSHASLTTSL